MDIEQQRILMKSYISSQFNYCPLIWMCHSRKLNNKIKKVYQRALKIVFGDYKFNFQEFLQKDNYYPPEQFGTFANNNGWSI